MFPTKILLATDGSTEAGRAARTATMLSERLGSELCVVLVEPLPGPHTWPESTLYNPEIYKHGTLNEVRELAEGQAHGRLTNEVEKLRGTGSRIAEAYARAGRPDAEIVAVAEEVGAGLVVVGSRGFGPLRRAVIGSVSHSVVRHAHCPVLVVRGDAQDGEPTAGPIVLAVDGSEEAKLAVRAAAELSRGAGSAVHLIYVLPTPARMFGHHSYSAEVEESLLEQARAEARDFLDEQTETVRSGGGEAAQTYLGTGRPDEEIVELAEEISAGMVVVGSRGLGGVRRALLGSVSDSVVRHAHGSVLVVRGEDRG